jgi:hypothetical protein
MNAELTTLAYPMLAVARRQLLTPTGWRIGVAWKRAPTIMFGLPVVRDSTLRPDEVRLVSVPKETE